MTLVLVIACIDLSVGSVMALSSAVLGLLVDRGWPLCRPPHSPSSPGLLRLVNGFVTVWWAVPSFIVTLGMLEIPGGHVPGDRFANEIHRRSHRDDRSASAGLGCVPRVRDRREVVLLGQVLLSRTVSAGT